MKASSSRRSLAGSRCASLGSFSDLQALAPSGPRKRSQSPARRVARLLTLRRLLAVVITVAVVLQVRSPGLATLPPASRASGLAAILQLSGDFVPASAGSGAAGAAAAAAAAANATAAPQLIPRIIHVGSLAGAGGATASRRYLESWQALNPGWEVRLYDERVRRAEVGGGGGGG